MKLSKISILSLVALFIAGCATTTIIPEPEFNSKDPSLTRLMLFVGKSRQTSLFKKFIRKYDILQKKYGKEGRLYPPDNAYSYWYYKDKIVKLIIAVQQPCSTSRFKVYTGKLPFNLKRRDTYESVQKKLGAPSKTILDKTIIEYKEKNLQIKFMNGRISTVIITSS